MVRSALKIAGAAYPIYLAWPLGWKPRETRSPLRVWHAPEFQFLNPKAWMMAISACAGADFWEDALADGFTREAALVAFAMSTENTATNAQNIEDGFWVG